MSAAFPQTLVRGLGAHSQSVPPRSSSLGPQLVPQAKGDPNYYATSPVFDSSGFWHAAGTNPPPKAPTGTPITPSDGEWLQVGSVRRNGQSTTFWVWYPPKDKSITLGKNSPGEKKYLVSRKKPTDSAKQLFRGPDYWVHDFVVAPPPKSSYSPQSLEYDTVEDIVPVVGTFHCAKWLLVASQNSNRLNATLPGGLFKPGDVFNYYGKYVGISPYFTWHEYLFKFEYTGYDAKTGKYRQGSQYTYTISMCVDGMNVQKNPSGDVANYTVYASGGGSGGELVVKGVGQMQSAFSVRGLGRSRDSVFSPSLLQGLGREPEGLGQLSQFSAGGNGVASLVAYAASAIPKVHDEDWVEFYPNDSDGFRANTNLALAAWEQASGLNFFGANPIGGAILSQVITTTTPGDTVVWRLTDPNNRAAYTIGMNGNESGDGNSPAFAVIRSSYDAKGKPRIEIALRTMPLQVDQFPGWPSKATLVAASSLPSNLDWAQEAGPDGFNLTSSLMPGQTIALTAGGTDLTAVINSFLAAVSQPQYLQRYPSDAWGHWSGWGVARGGYLVVPTAYFTYGGQTYKVYWSGTWGPGPGQPYSGPGISVAIIKPAPKTPPPAWLTPVAVPHFPPAHGPARPPASPPSTSVPVTAGGSAPVPATTSAAISTSSTSGLSSGAAVALTLVGAVVVGGVIYLALE
jgi:hypothetical protein